MKKLIFLLSLGVFLIFSCSEKELEPQVSNVSFTTCQQSTQQGKLKSSKLSKDVDVVFTNTGVQITYYDFEVTCDFTSVNVTHTLVNGVLRITQQGTPNYANCVCYTDVSYTIDEISQDKVNVIFINDEQVYCYNENKEGYVTFGANYHVVNCLSTVTIFLDGENIGTLQNPVDTISECGEKGSLTKKVSVGKHTYQVEIRGGCTKDITGTFVVSENECEKIFIDYFQVFANQSDCDEDVIISQTEYENAPNHPLSILDMKVVDDCLKIKFGASGCTGDNWNVKLIDSENIAESLPCQRTLRLSLNDIGSCAAYFEKEMSFNIEDLQIQGNHNVQLNISGKSVLYEY